MKPPELVLLVEPDGASMKLRPLQLRFPVNMFVERCHLDPKDDSKIWARTWVNTNDERALTGQRIFREELPPPTKEAPETPLYDELVVKNLKFGVDGATFTKMVKKYGKK